MIREAVLEVLESFQAESNIKKTDSADFAGNQTEEHERIIPHVPQGLDITISVPQGRELAAKTFNPKLGIEGGISILGTSGIVEPMSDQALLDTIRVEIRVRKEEGLTILPAAPGNYGKNFFLEKYGFSLDTSVTASNFIYDTVKMAADAGFTKMLFVGHIGKLVKVAGGIRNTHSQYGDHRMEILTEIAQSILLKGEIEQKADKDGTIPAESGETLRRNEALAENLRNALADCVMTDEAIRILKEYGMAEQVLSEMTRRIRAVMQEWAQGRMQVEVVVFSNVHGELGRTEKALEYMRILQEQIDLQE
jgi:cobalt-precorrin-5B (C1)-methyltransferase